MKVNCQYYRDVWLSQQMLPAIKRLCRRHCDTFVFQQDSAPAYRARDTIKLLQRETHDFIGPDLWPPNSTDLNPVYDKIWGVMKQRVYNCRVSRNIDEMNQCLVEVWDAADCHWLGCQPVETATDGVRACTGTTFWALAMSLSDRYLDWKNLCVNQILFNVVYSQKQYDAYG